LHEATIEVVMWHCDRHVDLVDANKRRVGVLPRSREVEVVVVVVVVVDGESCKRIRCQQCGF
jgi:hypothetical protein